MRRRLRALGQKAGWGTSARTMLNELYSAGGISTAVLRRLEALLQVRNALVHGFTAPVGVDDKGVLFLVDTARGLLADSQPARQTA